MEKIEFEYKPSLLKHLLGMFFYIFITICFTYLAITNERGVIFHNFIELSKENTTLFYWTLAFLPLIFVSNGIVVLYKSFFFKRKIIVSKKFLISPKNFISSQSLKVYYSEVISIHSTFENKKLVLVVNENKILSIPEFMVPKREDFKLLCALVKERVKKEEGIPPQKPTD